MTGRIGHTAQIHRSDDGTPTGSFASVGSIYGDVSWSGLSRNTFDDTTMQSADGFMEFSSALRDPGELSFTIRFNPAADQANITAWLTDFNSDARGYYKLIFPDGTEWGAYGLVTAFDVDAPLDDRMTAAVTLKLSGKPGFIA